MLFVDRACRSLSKSPLANRPATLSENYRNDVIAGKRALTTGTIRLGQSNSLFESEL